MSDTEAAHTSGFTKPVRILGGLYIEITILIFCGAIISATGQTSGPVFDVVGPDFLPTVVAVLVATLTLLQVVVQVARNWQLPGTTDAPIVSSTIGPVLIFIVATIAYVSALAFRMVPFFLATTVFVALTTTLLAPRFSPRDVLTGVVIGLLLGAGLQYIFTQVLIIDLPT